MPTTSRVHRMETEDLGLRGGEIRKRRARHHRRDDDVVSGISRAHRDHRDGGDRGACGHRAQNIPSRRTGDRDEAGRHRRRNRRRSHGVPARLSPRLMADFLDAIEHERAPAVTGAEALKVHRLIDALLRGQSRRFSREKFHAHAVSIFIVRCGNQGRCHVWMNLVRRRASSEFFSMSHVAPQTSVTGFDCRGCGDPIPVFAGASAAAMPSHAAIHIMCPHCGHSARYAAAEAYRFAGRSRVSRQRSPKANHAPFA